VIQDSISISNSNRSSRPVVEQQQQQQHCMMSRTPHSCLRCVYMKTMAFINVLFAECLAC
jgi:hypothetical protein